jgi:hypothetical protein
MYLNFKKVSLFLFISILEIVRITESTCAGKSTKILSTITESNEQKTSEPIGAPQLIVSPLIQKRPVLILTSTPCTNCNNQDVQTNSLVVSTTLPPIITTTVFIQIPIDCQHFTSSKFNIKPARGSLIMSKVVPTTNNNPVPCCFLCNLMANQGCVMYTYVINDGFNAVCNTYSLPPNTNYKKYIIRVNSLSFTGFTFPFINMS